MTDRIANRLRCAKILGEDFHDALRTMYLTVYCDISGSMGEFEDQLVRVAPQWMADLAKLNAGAEDVQVLVQFKTFNNTLHTVNTEFLPPEQMADAFDASTFRSCGGTDLSNVINDIDALCSRSSKTIARHSGDYCQAIVLWTDYRGNGSATAMNDAMDRLKRNRLFASQCQSLCVFLGPDELKEQVVSLVGTPDRIISVEDNLIENLPRILLDYTIDSALNTHIDDANTTPADRAEQSREKVQEGKESASDLVDDPQQLKDRLAELFQCAG